MTRFSLILLCLSLLAGCAHRSVSYKHAALSKGRVIVASPKVLANMRLQAVVLYYGPAALTSISNSVNVSNNMVSYWAGSTNLSGGWWSGICPNLTFLTWRCAPTSIVQVLWRSTLEPQQFYTNAGQTTPNFIVGPGWEAVSPPIQGTGQVQSLSTASFGPAAFYRLLVK